MVRVDNEVGVNARQLLAETIIPYAGHLHLEHQAV